MNKRQVRAAMRRLRTHFEEQEEEAGEINLVPYLDIVTNIIIFLLASVVSQMPLGNVNVTSPTIASSGTMAAPPPADQPPLNLTVTIARNGFIIAASGGQLPMIPLKDGKHDFGQLTQRLMEIKNDPGTGAQNETKAIFNADAHVPYEMVVQTLDAMREDPNGKVLFPDIAFTAGID